jgi:hypothetical protein
LPGWRCLLGFHYYTHRTPGDDPVVFALGPTATLRCDRCRRIALTPSFLDRISLIFATPGHMWRATSRKQRRALGIRRS